MNFFKNLKIRDKLLILLLLLLLPIFYFVTTTIRRELGEHNKLKEQAIRLEESNKISDLVHVFQRERALTLAATGENNDFLLKAKAQRGATDAAAKDLKEFLVKNGRSFPELSLLNELPRLRNDLDQNKLELLPFRQYSTNLIFTFLDKIEANATGIGNIETERQLLSFRSLTDAKIQLGRIRSMLMKVMQEGAFSYEDYALTIAHKSFYERSLKDFSKYADEGAIKGMQNILSSESYKHIAAIFLAIERDPQFNLSTLDQATVFNQFTQCVDGFALAEKAIIGSIRSKVDDEIGQKQSNLIFLATAFFLILGTAGLLSYYIINLISTSLSTLKIAADRIRVGETDVAIAIESEDEIGAVAASFRGVLQKNISLSKVAQAIGEGRYDVEVEVQSREDVLSYAIKDMKDSLQRLTFENETRSWILTGVSNLNNLILGETKMESVSEKIISFVCEYTHSDAGILYLHNDGGKLEPQAAYGVKHTLESLSTFSIGTGKVGQAVRQKRVNLLEGVEVEYLRIKTGLAEMEPANIIILPLLYASTVVGAIELSSRQKYSAVELQFFDTASERVAIALYTLKAHLQTQELLHETQNQAEELETQQEELRQLNAEMKASEEELRVSQEELQEKNAELEEKAQLLEEQYEALGAKNQALEDAREAIELKIQQVEAVSKYKSDFLANMSHELRTPLNSILILSRLLADNQGNTLTAKQTDHAQIIHKSGNDLLKLINEILDLSKIESGVIRLENEELKVRDITFEPLFKELATKKNIRFTETHSPGVFETITTDRFRLEQILKNFIANALKFTDAGGEVVLTFSRVATKPAFKSEQLREQSDIIAFSVRDTGIGIPKDKQDLVFEAFHQADSSTTRKYGGTGLGLTISKELAALLGGEIVLESKEGVGSTFTLYLPRIPLQESKKAPIKTEAAPSMAKTKSASQVFDQMEAKDAKKKAISVLIVEDDKGFSDILADFALAKNFKVRQAYTGNAGLQLAREEKPDAILLDINLPDTTGWEVLKEIRDDKELRHTNVHVMSAYDKHVTDGFLQNEDYLPKPVTLEMLSKAFTTISEVSDRSIETILIVEDNEIENRAVAELLLAHGLKSTSAFSAEEAEQVLAKQRIDCIVLDLNLPGMKGYEWMRSLKAKDGLAEIPIIIYSGKDLSEEEEMKLKEFANTIIIKNEYSYLRLLDEVQLFLHKVNQKLPFGNGFKMKLHVPEAVLQNKKVLLVDDDVRNVYSLSSLLEQQGMDVVVAYNGKDALQRLQTQNQVDLVLMDIMMPEMDGIEAIKHIRANAQFRRLPIIALTAKAMKEDKEKCIEAGASDYIPKPVDTDKLLTLMRVWLYEA